MALDTTSSLPRVGMMATLRNRRGIITAVQDFPAGPDGTMHLVTVDYTDMDGVPTEQLIWEREPGKAISEPQALPRVTSDSPMTPREFDALIRASRYSATTPYLAIDDPNQELITPLSSPFYGAVQVEDFQLVPLLKALRMPRVALLLADDVGLGKTIEAGLILNELLIRRRIRRVLILCPAALRDQWQQEMHEKFALNFDIIDRDETYRLKKQLGMNANPWRHTSFAIASYYYLRQPNVLEEFRAASAPDDSQPSGARQSWDLLIVDEAHNLMPANFGQDSDLSRMLQTISPWFEHKLFLTATPHNGYTRCFTGLLELLDSSRFFRTSEIDDKLQARIEQSVVRRLKSDINKLDDQNRRPRRFAERHLEARVLRFSPEEARLNSAFVEFRRAIKDHLRTTPQAEQIAGQFAIEVLNKRLLSGPITFANSWFRLLEGLEDEDAATSELRAAQNATRQDLDDDREIEERTEHAARTTGAWLRPHKEALHPEISAITAALKALHIQPDHTALPSKDARFDDLVALIKAHLLEDSAQITWRDDERLVLFTEYKTTLDYLVRRLRHLFQDSEPRILELYGGMTRQEREQIKQAFNDPDHPVRILVATDAASEGLNLQRTARLLLHYDIPWNPARLEQRNGRLDRHGQGRDVKVFHFDSREDTDLRFMSRVVRKVHSIREDLGSTGEVFDQAFHRYFLDQLPPEQVESYLEEINPQPVQQLLAIQSPIEEEKSPEPTLSVEEFQRHLDLTPENLAQTLEVALATAAPLPRFRGPDEKGRYRLLPPIAPTWKDLIDSNLRRSPDDSAQLGAIPYLAFDAQAMIDKVGDRTVFRPRKDTAFLHLGHALFKQALNQFARARFPNTADQNATRWIVRTGEIPAGAEALILLTVEELAINQLREPIHHWVRTLRIPVVNGELQAPLPYDFPTNDRPGDPAPELGDRARDLWIDLEFDLLELIDSLKEERTRTLTKLLDERRSDTIKSELERYDARAQEIGRHRGKSSIKRLEKELEERIRYEKSLRLTQAGESQFQNIRDEKRRVEEELRIRTQHLDALQEAVRKERDRFIGQILPQRLTLEGDVNIFPITVEIRFP